MWRTCGLGKGRGDQKDVGASVVHEALVQRWEADVIAGGDSQRACWACTRYQLHTRSALYCLQAFIASCSTNLLRATVHVSLNTQHATRVSCAPAVHTNPDLACS